MATFSAWIRTLFWQNFGLQKSSKMLQNLEHAIIEFVVFMRCKIVIGIGGVVPNLSVIPWSPSIISRIFIPPQTHRHLWFLPGLLTPHTFFWLRCPLKPSYHSGSTGPYCVESVMFRHMLRMNLRRNSAGLSSMVPSSAQETRMREKKTRSETYLKMKVVAAPRLMQSTQQKCHQQRKKRRNSLICSLPMTLTVHAR